MKYCICDNYDAIKDGMIECEKCQNWYHFQCIIFDKSDLKALRSALSLKNKLFSTVDDVLIQKF